MRQENHEQFTVAECQREKFFFDSGQPLAEFEDLPVIISSRRTRPPQRLSPRAESERGRADQPRLRLLERDARIFRLQITRPGEIQERSGRRC